MYLTPRRSGPFSASPLPGGITYDESMDMLKAICISSANDAAVALAHHVSGTTDAFLELMNARVKQMGCANTQFGNVSGLYTAESSSTARDMAIIVKTAIQNENFKEIFGAKSYTIPDTNLVQGRKEFKTQNYMIDDSTLQDFYDDRVTGGFASYYESYGASIVCTAESKNMNYIAVILGATRTFAENGWQPKVYGNFNEMSDLLDYAFSSFKVNRIIYDGMALSSFKVNGGECNVVGEAKVNVDSVVPEKAQMKNIQMNYTAVGGGLSAPIQKDQLIATLYRSIMDSISSNSFPAGPTKGSPCKSSCSPGPSPTNRMSACRFPAPNTTLCRVSHRPHRVQASHCAFSCSQFNISRSSCAGHGVSAAGLGFGCAYRH